MRVGQNTSSQMSFKANIHLVAKMPCGDGFCKSQFGEEAQAICEQVGNSPLLFDEILEDLYKKAITIAIERGLIKYQKEYKTMFKNYINSNKIDYLILDELTEQGKNFAKMGSEYNEDIFQSVVNDKETQRMLLYSCEDDCPLIKRYKRLENINSN